MGGKMNKTKPGRTLGGLQIIFVGCRHGQKSYKPRGFIMEVSLVTQNVEGKIKAEDRGIYKES